MQHSFIVTGRLAANDAKKHFACPFEVPDRTVQLILQLWHTEGNVDGAGLSNMLTLSLFDPQGFRGEGHRGGTRHDGGLAHEVTVRASRATPGYIAGPLQPGLWSVVINSHRITVAEPCEYVLTVEMLSEGEGKGESEASTQLFEDIQSAIRLDPRISFQKTALPMGWYRGDLHAHTVHSDGSWDVPDLLAAARAFQLDFVTLTDHNTVSALEQMDRASSDDLLTMGGMELTTFYGHALALGLRAWVDWRMRDAKRAMPEIADEVTSAGGLFVIAHPMAIGDPVCTGCSWCYDDMMPGPARIIEVWNGGLWENDSHNERARSLYYTWLNQGHRLVATSGTDVHGPFPPGAWPGFNVVFAESRTEQAILRAISQGHLYLSNGPHVELVGRSTSSAMAMMGDALPAEAADITVRWSGCSERHRLRLIVDGAVWTEMQIGERGEHSWHLGVGQARWCLIEIRDGQGHIAALTNPIFLWQIG